MGALALFEAGGVFHTVGHSKELNNARYSH